MTVWLLARRTLVQLPRKKDPAIVQAIFPPAFR